MGTFVFVNNLQTQLAAPITSAGQTTIVLASSANIPSIPAGSFLPITLNDALTGNFYEIVWATSGVGSTLTVLRGQEGTAAATWLVGDNAYNADTAATLNNFVALSPVSQQSGSINISGPLSAQSLNASNIFIGGTLTNTEVGIINDGLSVNGMLASVPATSTDGYRWMIGGNSGTQIMQLTSSGALSVQTTATTGFFQIGGSSQNAQIDYGETTGNILTISSPVTINQSTIIRANTLALGIIYATGTGSQPVPISGSTLTGDLFTSRSANSGGISFGGATQTAIIQWNTTTANQFVFSNYGVSFANFSAGTYTNASDAKFKDNIEPLSHGLDVVRQLKPSSFTMKHEDTGERHFGFIAQEVRAIIPGLVTEDNDKSLGIRIPHLIAILAKSIQDLDAKHEAYIAAHP